MRRTNKERHIPAYGNIVALEFGLQQRPIGGRGRFVTHAIIMNITDNTDNFSPVVFRADLNSFAERGGRLVPIFAREIFRDHGHGSLVVGIRPGYLAPGNQRCP